MEVERRWCRGLSGLGPDGVEKHLQVPSFGGRGWAGNPGRPPLWVSAPSMSAKYQPPDDVCEGAQGPGAWVLGRRVARALGVVVTRFGAMPGMWLDGSNLRMLRCLEILVVELGVEEHPARLVALFFGMVLSLCG